MRRLLAVIAAAVMLLPAVPAQAVDAPYDVLVFSRTAGFRHSSIPNGIAAIQTLGAANNFTVTATEDPTRFTTANLAQYEAVVFLSTTGDVLNAAQQTAFESYIAAGGGYVGVHAAADTEYSWPFYGNLVGAWFLSHPAQQNATVVIEDHAHPATAGLPATINRYDEWYNYRTNPRTTARVLASLNESSYSGGTMAGDHPITWCKEYAGGRSFYTGLGHTEASYTEANFLTMLLGGLRWAARRVDANCSPAPANVTVQAEAFSSQSGVRAVTGTGAIGGRRVTSIAAGDWIAYNNVNVGGAVSLQARVSGPAGVLQIRTGSATWALLGSVSVPGTANRNTYATVTATLSGVPSGPANVYLTFTGSGSLFDLDQFVLVKS